MSECLITYKGEKYSEAELDKHLRETENALADAIQKGESLEKIFSKKITSLDDSVAICEKIQKEWIDNTKEVALSDEERKLIEAELTQAVDDPSGDIESDVNIDKTQLKRRVLKEGGSIGPSEMFKFCGHKDDWNKPLVTPFNKKAYNAKAKLALEEDPTYGKSTSFTDADRQKILENKELMESEIRRKIGTDIHKIIQYKIEGKKIPGKDAFYYLTDEFIPVAEKIAEDIIKNLKSVHGDKCKIYSEFQLFTDKVNGTLMEAVSKNRGKKTDKISGSIDILVIDESGKAHVYDIKTSGKKVGDWTQFNNEAIGKDEWSSAKKMSYTAQVATYAAMLKQKGLSVATCNIIPIKIDTLTSGLEEYKGIENLTLDKFCTNIPQALIGGMAKNVRGMIPPLHTQTDASLEKLNSIMAALYPEASSLSGKVQRKERNLKFYLDKKDFVRKFIPKKNNFEDEQRASAGVTDYFIEKGLPGEKTVYCYGEQDKLNKLSAYVEKLNNSLKEELEQFGTSLAQAIISGEEDLDKIANSFGESCKDIVKAQFQKYIKQRWEFVESPDFNSNGIFIFKKGGRVEIVMVDSHPLDGIVELPKSNTILGEFEKQVDTTRILGSQYGNLLLMKAAALVAINKKDILEEGELIGNIKVVNPYHGTEMSVNNSQLRENWEALCFSEKFHSNKPKEELLNLPVLTENDFVDDLKACYFLADDIIKSTDLAAGRDLGIKTPTADADYSEKEINYAIMRLRQEFPVLYDKDKVDASRPEWQAYIYLLKAKLSLSGLHVVIEPDKGNWFEHYSPTGLMISAPDNSPSANVRLLGTTMQMYRSKVTLLYESIAYEWKNLLTKAYKEAGHSTAIGNERPLFTEWLKTNSAGEIDPEFRFKDPSDEYWKTHPAALKCMEYFCETMFKFKYGHEKEELQEKRRNESDYYKIPIVEQATVARIKEAGAKETWNSLKDRADQIMNMIGDTFAGRAEYRESWEKQAGNQGVLYNKYLDLENSQREWILENKGIPYCEKDLDLVFNVVAVAGCQSTISRDCHMLFTGMDVLLKAASSNIKRRGSGNTPMNNIIGFFDKYIQQRVYHKSIIEKQMQPITGFINGLKHLVTFGTLGFNSRSMFREGLQSFYTVASRAACRNLQDISFSDLWKQLEFMTGEACNNLSSMSFASQLNHRYSMANYSMTEMGEINRVAYWGLLNMNSNIAFKTSSVFDFFYRTSILLARLEKDGCKDAYVLENDEDYEDGKLTYKMNLDKRFSAAIIEDNQVTWDTSNPDYLSQLAIYKEKIKQFRQEGKTVEIEGVKRLIEEGDVLPDAYTSKEAGSIRADADTLLGHFDEETKALMLNTFLGSLFMQFKTFISAKFEQNFSPGHVINSNKFVQKYDKDGKKIYQVFTSPEEIEATGVYCKFMVEGDEGLQEALDEGRATPYFDYEGEWLQGTLVTFCTFAKALLTANQDELNEIWKDPIQRGRILLFLMDNVGMMLIALLLKLLYGSETIDNMKNMDWFTRWSYGVLNGATQDGPVNQVVSGMVGDFTPPMISSLQRAVEDWGSVIAGNKNAFYAILDNFGATRELTALTRVK